MPKRDSAIAAIVVLLLAPPVSAKQDRQDAASIDPRVLIQRLESRDEKIASEAAQDLLDAGRSVVPLLAEQLTRSRGCQLQFIASGLVGQLEPENPLVTPTLIRLVRGECVNQAPSDVFLRRQAGLVLAARADGIPALTTMLKDRDLFVSRTAAFGFDELAEQLIRRRPGRPSDDAGLAAAAMAALPVLVQALRHPDEMVRCLSFEALDELRVADSDQLRTEAVRQTDAVVAPRDCALPGVAPGWRKSETSR